MSLPRPAASRRTRRARGWTLARRAPSSQRGHGSLDVARVAAAVAHEVDPERVIDEVLDQAVEVLSARAAHVLVTDDPEAPRVLRLAGHRNVPSELVAILAQVALDAPILAARAARTRSVQLAVDDHTLDPSLEQPRALLRRTGSRSLISAPLVAGGRLYGTLTCALHERTFTEDEVAFVRAIAEVFAVGLANAALFRRERAAREEALASERRFRDVFDNALDAILVLDDHLHVVDANPAARALFAPMIEGGDVEGRAIRALARRFEPSLDALFEQLLTRGALRSELRIERHDGNVRDLELTSVARFQPGRHLVIVRDLTHRRRAEEDRERLLHAIADERNWLRTVIHEAPIPMVLIHGSGGNGNDSPRVFTNPRADALLLQAVARGTPLADAVGVVLTPDGQVVPYDRLPGARALRGETVVAEEYVVRRTDGSEIPVAVHAAPILGHAGVVIGAVAIFEDRTRIKEIERLREEWTSIVAHDLRQPAGVISLSADILPRIREAHPVQDREAQVLARVRTAAKRLDRMIADLLDVSRIEAGRLSVQARRSDAIALARQVVDELQVSTDRPIRLATHEDVPEACVDPDRYQQVLSNLIMNAVRYGAPGTPVCASLALRDDMIETAVRNEGPGIPPHEQPKLFERFFRAPTTRTKKPGGIGLGLYICKGLVEAQGGRIWVESAVEGPTIFRFTVPISGRCSG